MKYRTMINSMISAAALGALCLAATTVHATSGQWHRCTIAASTGTIDEKDVNKVELISSRAKILNSIDNTKVTIRYDLKLKHISGAVGIDYLILALRFKDNGDDARVVAKLKEYSSQPEQTTTLLTFDSNDFPDSNSFQRQQVKISSSEYWIFQLAPQNAYYVEVTLTKKSGVGKPELGGLAVWAREQ